MNKEFWNERYGQEDFAYGIKPNDFLKSQHFNQGAKLLCLAEGEGRNGVFLAKMGCDVTCVDYSEAGISKMKKFATENHVEIQTICADLNDFDLGENQWDGIIVIFGHFPVELRKKVHSQLFKALKPSGKLILEAYNKNQMDFKTGGPMNLEMLYSKEELSGDFKDFEKISINEFIREVQEGAFHFGKAGVVQVVGEK